MDKSKRRSIEFLCSFVFVMIMDMPSLISGLVLAWSLAMLDITSIAGYLIGVSLVALLFTGIIEGIRAIVNKFRPSKITTTQKEGN